SIVDIIGSPAVLLATRNKSTDGLHVKSPALRLVDKPKLADTFEGLENTVTFLINYKSIDQTELRPRSFAAKVSQKFTEAFANDVYIYSIRDKETFKNETLGYYNALKNNIMDTRGRPEELLATRNKRAVCADFNRTEDNTELGRF
ncbi:hypothetical protein SARC_13473, partial [Sphaeroforma arctica JP610]